MGSDEMALPVDISQASSVNVKMNTVANTAEMKAVCSQLHGMPLYKDNLLLPLNALPSTKRKLSSDHLLRRPTCHLVASLLP